VLRHVDLSITVTKGIELSKCNTVVYVYICVNYVELIDMK